MARAARRRTAILDADVVGHSRLMRKHERSWTTRLVQHRVERLEPAGARHEGKRKGRWTIAIAGGVLAVVVIYLASASALAGLGVPGAESIDRLQLERRAAAAFSRWLQASSRNGGEQDEADDQPANPANAPPADAYDGLYAGTATTRADSHLVTFRVKVTNGIGSGTQSRLDCGTAPVALKVSPSGTVSGMALVFGSTCLKTELAIRGRAVAGTLRLRLGSQFLELLPAD
jgi:class 3 adenylate cyclase